MAERAGQAGHLRPREVAGIGLVVAVFTVAVIPLGVAFAWAVARALMAAGVG